MAPGTPESIGDAHALAVDALAARLGVDPETGLSSAEATRRLAIAGANALDPRPPVPRWRRFLAQFESPLVLLLVAAGVVSFAVHLLEGKGGAPYEAITIVAIVVANAILGFVQEARAEAAVASLKELTAETALVLRDGERVPLAATSLVPGDVLVVEEGDSVPADARVIESVSMKAAEAALTGESAPVDKYPAALPADTGLADRANMLYAGTSVSYGHGLAIVTATGMRSEIGRIAAMIADAPQEATPLQRELDRTGRVLGIVVVAAPTAAASRRCSGRCSACSPRRAERCASTAGRSRRWRARRLRSASRTCRRRTRATFHSRCATSC